MQLSHITFSYVFMLTQSEPLSATEEDHAMRTAYSYLCRILQFMNTLQTQVDSISPPTPLKDTILNGLVLIQTGLGDHHYHGLLHIVRGLYFQTRGRVERDVTSEDAVPVYLRQTMTRAETLDNAYYVLVNIQNLLKKIKTGMASV